MGVCDSSSSNEARLSNQNLSFNNSYETESLHSEEPTKPTNFQASKNIIPSFKQNIDNFNIQKMPQPQPIISIKQSNSFNILNKTKTFQNQITIDDKNNSSNEISFAEAKDFLFNKCNIKASILDDSGTTKTGWGINEKRGPPGYLKDYIPPIGWTGIGLKAKNIYDSGDNSWIGSNNSPGEWYVGYHGVKGVVAIQNIYSEGFRRGERQFHQNSSNINPLTNMKHDLCGVGVYFTPDIMEANTYTAPIAYNNYNYRIIFMCRINPYKVRIADIGNNKEYWIVEGDELGDLNGKKRSDAVRPYRILFSKNKITDDKKNMVFSKKQIVDYKKNMVSPVSLNNKKNSQKKKSIMIPDVKISSNYINSVHNLTFDEAKLFLINGCHISPSILDENGDATKGWRTGKKSGPPGYLKNYIAPLGFLGIGLKAYDLYDGGNNDWISDKNIPGEWYIGYHGIRTAYSIQKIYDEGFRRGNKQDYKNSKNINPLTNSLYPICGKGSYSMPDINDAILYTNPIPYNGDNYLVILMCRINPYKVRIADIGNNQEYWIVTADKLEDLFIVKRTEEIRPYRILVMKV